MSVLFWASITTFAVRSRLFRWRIIDEVRRTRELIAYVDGGVVFTLVRVNRLFRFLKTRMATWFSILRTRLFANEERRYNLKAYFRYETIHTYLRFTERLHVRFYVDPNSYRYIGTRGMPYA